MPANAPPDPAAPPPFRPDPPVVIGILGGIAAGKSTVAARFAARGLRWVDADRIAREVTATPAVVAAVAAELGPELVTADGQLDRPAVADRVFRDPEARRKLEALTHPPVRLAILAALAAARAAGESVLLDVPLLLERGLIDQCDHVVFVAASPETRARRAAARGWQPDELARREAAQASLAEKRARAGFTVANDGPIAESARQVDEVLRQLGDPTR
ncbi:MAG: dephospho-CoA kinase [Planctomycetota bacterium]